MLKTLLWSVRSNNGKRARICLQFEGVAGALVTANNKNSFTLSLYSVPNCSNTTYWYPFP